MDKRKVIYSHPKLVGLLLKVYDNLGTHKKVKGVGNKIDYNAVLLKNSKIVLLGDNNSVHIDNYSRLYNFNIFVNGSNNKIVIGERCYLSDTEIYIEDNNNSIIIGNHTSVDGPAQFAAIEGTSIAIGDDSMFSGEIQVKTGDSHVIINDAGERINYSKNVIIGEHCWVGSRVIVLKGTEIKNNTIVGAGSVVTSRFEESNISIAGNPAKCIKKGISWKRERI